MQTPHLAPPRSASVLMPTYQGAEFLERVMEALAIQVVDFPWDVYVIDSGSSDGTLEIFQSHAAQFPVPITVDVIESTEFDHGDTRNQLAARSKGELLVFLTQDAIPSGPHWLATLARNFEDPLVGAAYCRNVPREDARVLTRVFSSDDPGYSPERREIRMPSPEVVAGMTADEIRVLHNFNNVASAIPRELWRRHPFPRTMMGEDVLIGRGILEAGYRVVYEAAATVDHSHDYGPEKMQWRGHVDGKFNVEWMERTCVVSEEDLETLHGELLARDVTALDELQLSSAQHAALCAEASELRRSSLRGLYEGGLSALRYPRTKMRADASVHVLYVVESLELVRELGGNLVRSGHRVTVFELSPKSVSGRLGLERDDRDGMRVLRAHDVADARVLEAAFEGLLACEEPDLVHVQSSRASALALCTIAHERGHALVVSVHDDGPLLAGRRESLEAIGLADLRMAHDPALRQAYLAAGGYDPQLFAYCPWRTEAREWEFRYRALCCIVRGSQGLRTLFSAPGAEARTEGEVVNQGAGWLLMRPGASAEFDLEGIPAGMVTLEVEQRSLAAEPDVVLGGRVLLDGKRLGGLAAQRASADDRFVHQQLSFEWTEGSRTLRLEPELEGSGLGLYLRLCRVSLKAGSLEVERQPDPPPPPADLARLAEELRVIHGSPIDQIDAPRVAVIIPNLNGRWVLADCLTSLANSDYDPERLEVIVVDNGSSDDTVSWTKKNFPQVRLVPLERNVGFAAGCNAGAQAAKDAEVLVFLNNDMWVEKGFLAELVSPLVREECSATTAKILNTEGNAIDTSGTGTTFLGIAVQPGYGQAPAAHHEVPRKTLFGCGGAMAIKASVFHDVGGFDEEYFAYYEDLDLGWRMWLLGHEIHYVPSAVAYHHHSHTSRRFAPEVVRLVMIRNSLYTCVKNYDDANLARVLPTMLALAMRRAHLKADIDEEPFRIEGARLRGKLRKCLMELLPRRVRIERMGAADLIAINDLLSNWEHWMQRRLEVQSRRKRTDAEIQRMFLEPLACVEGDPSYAVLQSGLIAMFGLEGTFGRS